ncbi:MAG: hypothetical protein JKY65_10295 [Planctomycetes bacterium]|nr:hypothetical protein [Planctomycetota bacterium]
MSGPDGSSGAAPAAPEPAEAEPAEAEPLAPARRGRPVLGVSVVAIGVLLLGAFVIAFLNPPPEAPGEGPEVPGPFVAYVWSADATGEYDSSWFGGTSPPLLQIRQVEPPTRIDGRVHHHVSWSLPGRRRKVIQEAWYRPGEDPTSWLCARRRIGGEILDLDPPLPVLVAPLHKGARWEWSGRIGDREARVTFEVLSFDPETLQVRQTSILADGTEAVITRTYQPGRGLVREEGAFPYEPKGDTVVVTRRESSGDK